MALPSRGQVRRDCHDQSRCRPPDPSLRRLSGESGLGPARQDGQTLHADRALCPRIAHHHRADGDPAIGGRLRVHGAALEFGDAEAVVRGRLRHRGTDRRLSRLSAGRAERADPADRAGAARARGRFPARERNATARAEAVFLAARPGAVGGIAQDQAPVLDRHRRQIGAGRNPHPARQRGDARARTAQRSLRVEFGNLPVLDGRHLAGAADRGHHLPAQPDPADPAARRRRRSLRQGPRHAEFPAARRARGPARGGRLHRDEAARRARDRAAHHDARRRLARPAHHPHAVQARTRDARQRAGDRRAEEGRRRDAADAGGLSRLRTRRHGRAGVAAPTWRRSSKS